MYNIEIRGNNLQELYANAVNLVVLLARGGNTVMTPNTPASETPSANAPADPAPPPAPEVIAEPNPSVSAPSTTSHRKPGRPKAAPTIEATTTEVVAAKPEGEGIPDFLQRTVDAKAEAPTLDLDKDIRPRIRAINAAYAERAATSGKKDSEIAIDGVNYIKKLFAEFKIAKAADLPATQYAEFMAKSQAYLEGTA